MPQPTANRKLQPSILDRLIDDNPRDSGDPSGAPNWSLARAKAAVKRDLEWLLNARQTQAGLPDDPGPLGLSLLTYGLPDLASLSLAARSDRDRLCRAIREAVGRFEPRLTGVEVRLETARESDRAVRFRIDAVLRVEPEPEPVSFDSVLRLDTRAFVVGDGAAHD